MAQSMKRGLADCNNATAGHILDHCRHDARGGKASAICGRKESGLRDTEHPGTVPNRVAGRLQLAHGEFGMPSCQNCIDLRPAFGWYEFKAGFLKREFQPITTKRHDPPVTSTEEKVGCTTRRRQYGIIREVKTDCSQRGNVLFRRACSAIREQHKRQSTASQKTDELNRPGKGMETVIVPVSQNQSPIHVKYESLYFLQALKGKLP